MTEAMGGKNTKIGFSDNADGPFTYLAEALDLPFPEAKGDHFVATNYDSGDAEEKVDTGFVDISDYNFSIIYTDDKAGWNFQRR